MSAVVNLPLRLGLTVLAMTVSNLLYAQNESPQLEQIILQAQNEDALAIVKQQLNQVAGATNLIDLTDVSPRLMTNADILQNQPGIYAQSAGNEGNKISIRGSGLNRGSGAHASGTFVLLDGIAYTGPGGTPYELLEPNWLAHVEVLRGANGFERGALALGGAVNYVSQTGKTQQGGLVTLSTGTNATQNYHFSYGQDLGALDYYLAVTHKQTDGYQQHSESQGAGITANLGYHINDQIHTRFYARYRETEHQTPGRLTQEQIQTHPEMANPYNVQIDAKRIQPGSTWLANQTTWQLANDGQLQASLAYHDYPMDLQESAYRIQVDYTDVTAQLNWSQPYIWLGRENTAKVGLRSTTQHNAAQGIETLRFDNALAEAGTVSREYIHRGHDRVLNLDNDMQLKPNLWLSTGIAAIYTEREAYVTYPTTDKKLNQNEWDYAYRLGLRYELQPQLQLYSNISRSVEPAHAWSMLWGSDQYFPIGSGAATGRQEAAVPLKNQTATTFEVGARGEHRFGDWDISYYYAALKNELLMVEIQPQPNQIVAESNASDTIHQGIEIGLSSPLWQHPHWGEIHLKQAYTWNHFYYKNDPKFNANELAGIPQHFYQAKLQYNHPQGISMAFNTEYAHKMPIDYANSKYSEAYHVWGINMAWQHPQQQLRLWLELKNLTNEHYSSTITPGFNDDGQDRPRATPAEGRSMYAGIGFKF